MFDFPNSSLLSFARLWESFSYDDNIRKGVLIRWIHLVFIKRYLSHLVQIVCQHSIIIIDDFSEVSVHNEGLICLAKIRSSCKLQPHHFEFLPLRSKWSRCIDIEFYIFNVDDDEFGEKIPWADRCELVLVIGWSINFKSTHSVDVYEMNECCHFIY